MRRTVHVGLKKAVDDSYDILIEPGLLDAVPALVAHAGFGRRYVLLCDANTEVFYGRELA
jgi:hypothetical protein